MEMHKPINIDRKTSVYKSRVLSTVIKKRRQQGVVLVTGLIFLLVLMLVGITGTENSVFELNMAGNVEDEKVAFYAASAGLDSILFLEQNDLIASTNKPLQALSGLDAEYNPFDYLPADVDSPLEVLGVDAEVTVASELNALNITCPRTEASTSNVFCDKYLVGSLYENSKAGQSQQYQGYLKQVIDLRN